VLESASENTTRGVLDNGFDPEEVAFVLGIERETVESILSAMQGKVIEGQRVINWDKRNPKREDDRPAYSHRTPQNPTGNRTTPLEERRGEESKRKHTSATADAEQVNKAIEQQFAEIWAIYPKREGGNPRHDALKSYKARRRTGVDHQVMLEGVQRYASYCHAKGWIQTSFVKQAAVFFGPAEHYLESWEIGSTPPTTNGLGSLHKLVPASEINTNVIDWRKEALES
jgi:hypothetical protein